MWWGCCWKNGVKMTGHRSCERCGLPRCGFRSQSRSTSTEGCTSVFQDKKTKMLALPKAFAPLHTAQHWKRRTNSTRTLPPPPRFRNEYQNWMEAFRNVLFTRCFPFVIMCANILASWFTNQVLVNPVVIMCANFLASWFTNQVLVKLAFVAVVHFWNALHDIVHLVRIPCPSLPKLPLSKFGFDWSNESDKVQYALPQFRHSVQKDFSGFLFPYLLVLVWLRVFCVVFEQLW